MAERLEQPNSLPHHENDQKSEYISNICNELIDRIFDFLDLSSLLNVADTCKRLQIAAAAKFGDQYGHKSFVLYPRYSGFNRDYYFYDDHIEITNHVLQLLRCFGAKILDLKMHDNTRKCNQYINQYCVDTLTTISLSRCANLRIENFRMPFKKVVKVCISGSYLGNSLPNFVNLFPNLRYLEMDDNAIDENSVAVHFPHLEHLNLCMYSKVFIENAVNLLQANPHLQSFKICSNFQSKIDDLLNMISGNTSISKLKAIDFNTYHVNTFDLNRFANEHPTIVELELNYSFTANTVIMFIGQLNSLKKFIFGIQERSEYDHLINQLDKKWQHRINVSNPVCFLIEITLSE